MDRKKKIRLLASKALTMLALFVLATWTISVAKAQAPSRFIGTVSAINGTTLTVKTDAARHPCSGPSAASIKRSRRARKI